MSSGIATIYSTLAAKSITVNGVAITGVSGANVPNNTTSAELPLRILSSLSAYLFENVSDAPLWMTGAGGQLKQMTWQIADLLLYAPAGSGTGVGNFEPWLLAYIAAYADMLASDTALSALNVVRVDPTWANGIYEYPPQSEQFYYGSLVNLTILEKW